MMDQSLVDSSFAYHGSMLVDCLAEEKVDVKLPSFLALTNHGKSDKPRDMDFLLKLTHFIAKKADVIFEKNADPHTKKIPSRKQEKPDDFVSLAPLETFMEVPGDARRTHFLQSVAIDAVVMGHVVAVQESGLLISVFSLDYGGARDIDHLGIMAFCPLSSLPRYYAHESPLEAFAIKDKVRGIVISFSADHENIVISMQSKALPSYMQHIQLGLVGDEELPSHYRQLQNVSYRSYQQCLQSSKALANPLNVQHLCSYLGLETDKTPVSLVKARHRASYLEEDYADKLRQAQSHRMALRSVAAGVACFKNGNLLEAMQHLNKALQVDPINVEALVARGALYANSESFENAVNDFKEALRQNPHHKNARKYICETLVAQAKVVMEDGNEDEAIGFLRDALRIDPCMDEANTTLFILKNKQALAESKRRSSTGQAEPSAGSHCDEAEVAVPNSMQETTETLRRLIEDDKRHSRKRKRSSTSESESNSKHESEHRKRKDGQDSSVGKLRCSSKDRSSNERCTDDGYRRQARSANSSVERSPARTSPVRRLSGNERNSRDSSRCSPKRVTSRETHTEEVCLGRDGSAQLSSAEQTFARHLHEEAPSGYNDNSQDRSRYSPTRNNSGEKCTGREDRQRGRSANSPSVVDTVSKSPHGSSSYIENTSDRSRYQERENSSSEKHIKRHPARSVDAPFVERSVSRSPHGRRSSSYRGNSGDQSRYSKRQHSSSDRHMEVEQRHYAKSVRSSSVVRSVSRSPTRSARFKQSSTLHVAAEHRRHDRSCHSPSPRTRRRSSYDDRSRSPGNYRSKDGHDRDQRRERSSNSSSVDRSRARSRHVRRSNSSRSSSYSSSSYSSSRSGHRRSNDRHNEKEGRHRARSISSSSFERSRSRSRRRRSGSYKRSAANLSFLFDASRPAKRRKVDERRYSSSDRSRSSSFERSPSSSRYRRKSYRRGDEQRTSSKLSFLFDSKYSPQRRNRNARSVSSSSERSRLTSPRYRWSSKRKSDDLMHSKKSSVYDSRDSPKYNKQKEGQGSEERHRLDDQLAEPSSIKSSTSSVSRLPRRSDDYKEHASSESSYPTKDPKSSDKCTEENDYKKYNKQNDGQGSEERHRLEDHIAEPSSSIKPSTSRRSDDFNEHASRASNDPTKNLKSREKYAEENDYKKYSKQNEDQHSEGRYRLDDRLTQLSSFKSSTSSVSRLPRRTDDYNEHASSESSLLTKDPKSRDRCTEENDYKYSRQNEGQGSEERHRLENRLAEPSSIKPSTSNVSRQPRSDNHNEHVGSESTYLPKNPKSREKYTEDDYQKYSKKSEDQHYGERYRLDNRLTELSAIESPTSNVSRHPRRSDDYNEHVSSESSYRMKHLKSRERYIEENDYQKYGEKNEDQVFEERRRLDDRLTELSSIKHSTLSVSRQPRRSDSYKEYAVSESSYPTKNPESREKYIEEREGSKERHRHRHDDRLADSLSLKHTSLSVSCQPSMSDSYKKHTFTDFSYPTKNPKSRERYTNENDYKKHTKENEGQGSEQRQRFDERLADYSSTEHSLSRGSRQISRSDSYKEHASSESNYPTKHPVSRERCNEESDYRNSDQSISSSSTSKLKLQKSSSNMRNIGDVISPTKPTTSRGSYLHSQPYVSEKRIRHDTEMTSSNDQHDQTRSKLSNYTSESDDDDDEKVSSRSRHKSSEVRKVYVESCNPEKQQNRKAKKLSSYENVEQTRVKHPADDDSISDDEQQTKFKGNKRHSAELQFVEGKLRSKKCRKKAESKHIDLTSGSNKGNKNERDDSHADASAMPQGNSSMSLLDSTSRALHRTAEKEGLDREGRFDDVPVVEQRHKKAATSSPETSQSGSAHSRGLVSYQLSSDEQTSFGKWNSPVDDRSHEVKAYRKSKKQPISSPTISTSTPKENPRKPREADVGKDKRKRGCSSSSSSSRSHNNSAEEPLRGKHKKKAADLSSEAGDITSSDKNRPRITDRLKEKGDGEETTAKHKSKIESPKETLDDMENFLKMLKAKKKEKM